MGTLTLELQSKKQSRLRSWLAGCIAVAAWMCVHAADYVFHIAAAGVQWAQQTFVADKDAEFVGANAVVATYARYTTPRAVQRGVNDNVYVVYFDGRIAKFKPVFHGSTRLEFVQEVRDLPGGAKVMYLSSGQQFDAGTLTRSDYASNHLEFVYERRELRGSVEVVEYPVQPGCAGTVHCPNPARVPDQPPN